MSIRRVVKIAVLTVIALVWVGLPLWMLVVNSVKPEAEAGALSAGLPETWAAMENYWLIANESVGAV